MASPGSLLADTIAAANGVTKIGTDQERVAVSPLVSKIFAFQTESRSSRMRWETQSTNNVKAYRGEDVTEFRSSEDPTKKVFIRTTTVKTRAAYAQIMEALMANSRFPISVESTPVPTGVPLYAHIPDGGDAPSEDEPDSQEDFGLIGFPGDGKTLEPGATFDNMAFTEDPASPYDGANLAEGPDRTTQGTFISPAKRAAEQMNRVLQDQLEESNAPTELRKSVFECCLIGTGVIKGVFTDEKTMHRWAIDEKDGIRKYAPIKTNFPKISHVSAWDLYMDPNAMIAQDAEWMIERHRYTSKQMRDLKKRLYFDKEAIDNCIASGANYVDQGFEFQVREESVIFNKGRLWEVLEYWGYISKDEALAAGLKFNAEETGDQIQVNIWVCGNQVLRIMSNPFLPQRLPYFVFNYEQNPYNALGIGVPETMEDSQAMMNGFARLAVENLALAGNMVFDIDETMLVPGQTMEIYPGKIFKRQGGQTGVAVNGIKFPSTAQENMLMFREFRQIADESTGIPSVSHGQTGVTGVGRTSSGLSTILEAASLNIKTVIRNLDDDLFQPLGRALFYWNNQFNAENIPEGDFDVVATGVRSYTKQEIKSQRLQTFLQLSANPAIAPLIKIPTLIRELAIANDLDPNEIVNDMEDAKIYAEIIGAAGGISSQGRQAAAFQENQATPGGQGTGAGNPTGTGNEGGANVTPAAPSPAPAA
jgi:hypothetical protein